MGTLVFFDKEHQYELNGEVIPSVSEISRFASREIYGDVNQYTLDNACSRGSSVHKATEILDKYNEVECDNSIEQYVRAYMQFRKDFGIKEYLAIEKALASSKMRYAGTIDRIYKIDDRFANEFKKHTKVDISNFIGKLIVIDLKSSSVVQKVLAQIQLNAYEMLVSENGIGDVKVLMILHLDKDGKYKIHNFEIDNTLFMACYTIHKALEKKKRVKKEQDNV